MYSFFSLRLDRNGQNRHKGHKQRASPPLHGHLDASARGLQRHQRLRLALAHEHRRLRVRAEVPEAAGPQGRGARCGLDRQEVCVGAVRAGGLRQGLPEAGGRRGVHLYIRQREAVQDWARRHTAHESAQVQQGRGYGRADLLE